MAETDRDAKLAQAYRALGAEEPPRALDEAILAAARARPARWRVPLSIAAVLVLAVGVTLRMLPRQPDAESVALAPQVIRTPRPAAPPAEQVDKLERSAPRAAAPMPPEAVAARGDAATGAPAAAGARAAAEEARELKDSAAANAAAEPRASRPATAAAPAPRALAAAKLAEPATPEAWLERIAELKKQGREREAEESLAEFKKRYPGYKIPEALTR
jgi:hypothetical protein